MKYNIMPVYTHLISILDIYCACSLCREHWWRVLLASQEKMTLPGHFVLPKDFKDQNHYSEYDHSSFHIVYTFVVNKHINISFWPAVSVKIQCTRCITIGNLHVKGTVLLLILDVNSAVALGTSTFRENVCCKVVFVLCNMTKMIMNVAREKI